MAYSPRLVAVSNIPDKVVRMLIHTPHTQQMMVAVAGWQPRKAIRAPLIRRVRIIKSVFFTVVRNILHYIILVIHVHRVSHKQVSTSVTYNDSVIHFLLLINNIKCKLPFGESSRLGFSPPFWVPYPRRILPNLFVWIWNMHKSAVISARPCGLWIRPIYARYPREVSK